MKNVCIVGYGAIGPIHAAAIEKVQSAKLYAICDIIPERCAQCSEKYPGIKEYYDFDKMLEDDAIDSVHICTPHYLHYEMIIKALDKGKTVVAEKPVTMTRDEFIKLSSHPERDKVCLVLQNRLNPCAQKLFNIAKSGEMGKLITARGLLTWIRDKAYYNSEEWRGKWATEGGGVLINQAVHTLDLISHVAGEIKSLKAHMMNYSLPDVIEVEDTFTAHMCLEGNIPAVFFATNSYGANSTPDIELIFENGTLRYTDNKLFKNGEVIETDEIASGEKSYWGLGHVILLRRYYDEGSYFKISDADNTMRAMFAMYESAKSDSKEIII